MESNRIFLSPPHMSGKELDLINEAFQSNYIAPLGPQVDAFEKEFAQKVGFSSTVALSSGTAAIHLALKGLGVDKKDEVFLSTLTFIGSVSPVTFFDAYPVFIDADRNTWNMDPKLLERELELCEETGKRPKAVVPTDLYGQCCDLQRIVEICDRFEVPVICDSAEALGAKFKKSEIRTLESENSDLESQVGCQKSEVWRHAGKGAKAAVYSFNGNKIITTSGGGILASDDEELIEYARFLSQQARDPFPHYEHSEIGYNYRMSNILAAIGRGQLRILGERVRRRREIFAYYLRTMGQLPGISFMPEPAWSRSNRWLTVILVEPSEFGADREQIRLALEKENIESRPVWKPMHLQPVFNPLITQINTDSKGKKQYPCRVVGGSVSEKLFEKGLCLPSGTAMANSDIDRVIEVILTCKRQ